MPALGDRGLAHPALLQALRLLLGSAHLPVLLFAGPEDAVEALEWGHAELVRRTETVGRLEE